MLGRQSTRRSGDRQPRIRAALTRLGIDRLVLSIHQASFPADADDVGHGAPASPRGLAFVDRIASLGFTGVALGPAGLTTRDNASPYDGTALSRNPMHVAFGALVAQGWLDERELARWRRAPADRVAYEHAWDATRALLARVDAPGLDGRLAARRRAASWLATEARYEAIAAAVGHEDWARWPAAPPLDAAAARAYEIGQLVADEQHAAFGAHAAARGITLYGDLSIGTSHRDRWWARGLFLDGYALGAPPSRTNPAGQPWGFPVLDPAAPAAEAFVARRLARALDGVQGVRIDHPHGWVCPWVYRTDDPEPLRAVQRGARLFESPDLADHPALAPLARVRPDQLDRSRPRHDDAWVRDLEPAQVDAYAATIDGIVALARAHGAGPGELMVEVLSTCPRPLAAVLARHGLGRFRVTQKARVDVVDDVYRGDRAEPPDWIMVGNHDTPPVRAAIARWRAEARGEVERRAAYLGARLRVDPAALAGDDDALATALVAELFLGPARNVLLFWVDLFGGDDLYNRPGVVDPANWCLRVPPDFDAALARPEALDVEAALAWALRARDLDHDGLAAALVAP